MNILLTALLGLALAAGSAHAADFKIALVYSKTGDLQADAAQTERGLRLGLEYATKGTMQIDGRAIVIITKDDQGKPDLAKSMLDDAYKNDGADIAIGTTSSDATVAMLPVAAQYKKILIVDPATADEITGDKWNRYIFRTARSLSQDAVANAVSLGKPGVTISTIAQDSPFGHDGVAAFRAALAKTGATLGSEEYVPLNATDLTQQARRLMDSLIGRPGRKIIWVLWSGPSPIAYLGDIVPSRFGVDLSTPGDNFDGLTVMKPMEGLEGATYYYYRIPSNPVNDWLVDQDQQRFSAPPDFATVGGFSAAMAVVTAVQKAQSTDTEKLISAMEGMSFDTPKGTMTFRKEDHQALQSMYHFKLKTQSGVAWAVPQLVQELKIPDLDIPVTNKH